MKYTLNISKLETQEVEVRQFEHNVTTVNADFTPDDVSEDLQDLTPCILLSMGDNVTGGNGLSYIITAEKTAISWEVSEIHTQRAGTFFAQFGFIAEDGSLKAYTEKFIFRVLPSVDWQKKALEYKPGFFEAFWNKIVEKIKSSVPTKLSQLENDKSFVSTPDGLAEYAKTTDINETLKGYATNSDVEEKISACAQSSQVEQELKSYAKTSEVNEKLAAYARKVDVNATLSDYAKTTTVTSKISDNNIAAHSKTLTLGKFPTAVTSGEYNNAYYTANSSSTYFESVFVNSFNDGGSAYLESLSFLFNTQQAKSTVTARLEVYLNGATADATGTKIGSFDNFLVINEVTYAVIGLKKIGNEFVVIYTRYNTASKTNPVETSCRFIGNSPVALTSFKFKLVPSTETPAVNNFTGGIKFTISGQRLLS